MLHTDGLPDLAALPPEVAAAIEDLRSGKLPNKVHAFITRANGTVEDLGISENLRTNAGADWQANVMGSSSQPAQADWIALTTNTGAPAAGDTTLTGEIASGGLSRSQGVYAHTGGTTSYTITETFTASATHTAVHKAGLFNASSGGTMVFETNLNSDATLNSGDTLTITWTVNI